MSSAINEATFEARISAEVKRVFPAVASEITHQKIMNLRFGHHSVVVDGELRDRAFGRLDVLLEHRGKPLAVLELKRPGVVLTDDDRVQGLSYARVLEPMPPLVVVTNGSDLKIYQSYDGTALGAGIIGAEEITKSFKTAALAGASSRDEAIRVLLGRDGKIWRDLLRSFTSARLEERRGEMGDVSRPLGRGFSIPRKAARQVVSEIQADTLLVALSGPPLSGKTNVLAQVCAAIAQEESAAPLYVDAHSLRHGILDELTNLFSGAIFSVFSREEVRKWLLSALSAQDGNRLVLLVDGWSSSASDKLASDLSELLQISKGRSISIVVALDETTNQNLSIEPGRLTATEFGRLKKEVHVGELDEQEMDDALDTLGRQFNVTFYPGIRHNVEYRHPRYFRVWAAAFAGIKREAQPDADDRVAMAVLSPVTGVEFLDTAWQKFSATPAMRTDLNRLAEAYIADEPVRKSSHQLALLSYGRLFISTETAEKILGSDRIARLTSTGHLNLVDGPGHRTFYLPALPELVAAAGAHLIGNEIQVLLQQGNVDSAYERLLRASGSFPIWDAVAASAVIRAGEGNEKYFDQLIRRLLSDPPVAEKVADGQRLLMEFEGHQLDVPSEMFEGEGQLIGNMAPWLILSHLAVSKLGVAPGLLAEVGSCEHLLRRIEPGPGRQPFETHSLPGGIEAVCSGTGIVEPITASLLAATLFAPKDMVDFAQGVVERGNLALAMRLSVVSGLATSCTDSEISDRAVEISGLLNGKFRAVFEGLHGA